MSKLLSIIMLICLFLFTSSSKLRISDTLTSDTDGCYWKSCGRFDLCCSKASQHCKVKRNGSVLCKD